jgi:hypothetical protein
VTASTSEIQLLMELKTVCSSWRGERYGAAREVQMKRVDVTASEKCMLNFERRVNNRGW